MAIVLKEISTITAKGQTTIPKSVRQALGVESGGRIAFLVDEHGVTVHRADAEQQDPVIESFLTFLSEDIKRNPERLSVLTPALAKRLAPLTEGVDIEAPINGGVDLWSVGKTSLWQFLVHPLFFHPS